MGRRCQAWIESAAAAEQRYLNRYIPGERIYVEEIHPAERAQLVVDNEDPAKPVLIR
ncbi:hypothetical protein OG809_01510 [Kribbella soli]